jgi:hypothetical protein
MSGARSDSFATVKDEVLELLGRVPRPPDVESCPRATPKELEDFAVWLGARMPDELREWLRSCNGAPLGPGGVLGVGSAPKSLNILEVMSVVPEWRESRLIPIAGDGNGNYFVLAADSCEVRRGVYFIDTSETFAHPAYVVASGLWHFLRFLFWDELGETRWPFDRDYVVAHDPKIEALESDLLPWNT